MPTEAPTSNPANSANTKGTPCDLYSQALTMIVSARLAATDRSIPPMRMTSVAPAAMIPISEDCDRMLLRLLEVRKSGERKDSAITMRTRPMIGPPSVRARASSRPATGRSVAVGRETSESGVVSCRTCVLLFIVSPRTKPGSWYSYADLRYGHTHDRFRIGLAVRKDRPSASAGHDQNAMGQAENFFQFG